MNRLHETRFWLIYNDKRLSFENLSEKNNFVSVQHINLQALAIKMLKVCTKTSPEIMKEVFPVKKQANYHLEIKQVL